MLTSHVKTFISRRINVFICEIESEDFSSFDREDLILEGAFRAPSDEDFYSTLPKIIQDKLNKIVSHLLLCSNHSENYLNANELKPSVLLNFLINEKQILQIGMDKHLYQIFKKNNKEILELDEGDDGELERNECEALSCLHHYEEIESKAEIELQRLQIQYLEGNLSALESDTLTEDYQLTERNFKWIPKIMFFHCIKQFPALFAVGAAHLIGPAGILNILQNSGFTIKRMDSEGNFSLYDVQRPAVCSAIQLQAQADNYQLLRTQILEPSHPTISWLYAIAKTSCSMAHTMDEERDTVLAALPPLHRSK